MLETPDFVSDEPVSCFHDMPEGNGQPGARPASGSKSSLAGGGGGSKTNPDTPEVFKPTNLTDKEIDGLKPVKREIEIPAYMAHLPSKSETVDVFDGKIAITSDGPTYAKYQLRGVVNESETTSLMIRDPSDRNGRYLGGYTTKREAVAASKALLKARLDWSTKSPQEIREEMVSILQKF